jgi:hypothetical protein
MPSYFNKSTAFFHSTLLEYYKKRPWSDSNARTQLRGLVLYPPELQGHTHIF